MLKLVQKMEVAERRRKKTEQQQNKCLREKREIKKSENLLLEITHDSNAV